ncbi:hypothetical protein MVEG_00653 [Podila verticillata NRRL 6337]|nr:hypothetical protein MVEG_00653 [Podila verticillata NRRL 6337]
MDLPEIRTHLAQFLNHKDTVACAMVCRDWHQSFVSYIWHTGCFDGEAPKKRPPSTAMVKNGHFIRLMMMETVDRAEEYLQYCPNLEKIYFRFPCTALTRFKELTMGPADKGVSDDEDDEDDVFGRRRGRRAEAEMELIQDQFWEPVAKLVVQSPKLTEMYFCRDSPAPSAFFLETVSRQKAIIGFKAKESQGDHQHQETEGSLFSPNTYRDFKRVVFYRQMFNRTQSQWLTVFLSRCKEITLCETQHYQPQLPTTTGETSTIPPSHIPPPEEWSFPLTASLDLGRIVGLSLLDQVHLLTRMPELKSLEFALEDSLLVSEVVGPFCAAIAQYCPLLQVFSFTATPNRSLTEAQQVQVIEAPQMAIKKLCLEGFDFGLDPVATPPSHSHLRISSFDRLLDRFALTLTALDLNKCFRVSSKHTQKILTSCPNLEYCVLLGLHVADIFGLPRIDLPDREEVENGAFTHGEGKDWVSLKLKGLSVYICGLKDASPVVHAQVFARLAKLTRLQKLNVGNSGGLRFHEINQAGWRKDGLDCRLSSGLGALASLTQMQEFSMVGLHQQLEVQDVVWMTHHWRGLQRVTGSLSSTNARPLIEVLDKAKIKVKGAWA